MARPLLRLLPGESEEEVVDEGGELVADQDPVLVDQVVGGDVGVGPAESLLQRVPLEGRNHVMLCQTCQTQVSENRDFNVDENKLQLAGPTCNFLEALAGKVPSPPLPSPQQTGRAAT